MKTNIFNWKEETKRFIKPFNFVYCNDAIKGDYVVFTRSIFGKYNAKKRTAEYLGQERIEGIILKESYGEKTHQHTFTIYTINDKKILIKGRNMYENKINNINCIRALWEDEKERKILTDEKHERSKKTKIYKYDFNL